MFIARRFFGQGKGVEESIARLCARLKRVLFPETRPLPLPPTITVVSFNVARFEPSASAPAGFDSMTAFLSEILQHQPDIICLQEVPSGMTNVFRGYLSLVSTESHCENVVLLVKEEWAHLARRIVSVVLPYYVKSTFPT
jgi:hypothetical protein